MWFSKEVELLKAHLWPSHGALVAQEKRSKTAEKQWEREREKVTHTTELHHSRHSHWKNLLPLENNFSEMMAEVMNKNTSFHFSLFWVFCNKFTFHFIFPFSFFRVFFLTPQFLPQISAPTVRSTWKGLHWVPPIAEAGLVGTLEKACSLLAIRLGEFWLATTSVLSVWQLLINRTFYMSVLVSSLIYCVFICLYVFLGIL